MQIVFYKQLRDRKKDDTTTREEDERAPFVLCYYTVFNVEQCDGLTLPQIEQPTTAPEIDADETCEAIVTGWENRPALHLTSATECRAYYRPSTDSVHMPVRSRFVDAPHYYSTFFHELIHSTAHETRLNRTFGDRFGDDLYSKEELVAEMGAAFLCAIAEIANEHIRVLAAIGAAIPVRLMKRDLLFVVERLAARLDEDRLAIVAKQHGIKKAKDSDSIEKLFAAFLRRAEESVLGRLTVELTIMLAAARSNAPTVLKDAAAVYKVDTDVIAAKVKQEFADKEKTKATKKLPGKTASNKFKKTA